MPAVVKRSEGKKKKKSKKELEAERLALEEQLQREEEAARLAELAREQERGIAEQRDCEEKDALLDQEEPTFATECAHVQQLYDSMTNAIQSILTAHDQEEEWNAFISCSRIPNPLVEADVASYLSEFQQLSERPSFEELESNLSTAEQLHSLLEKYLARSIDHQWDVAFRFADNIHSLRKAIDRKWDALTAHILQNSDLYPRESTENLLIKHKFSPTITYCVWANYTKNPRHKSFDVFDSIHVTLPKALTLANVAIRIIYDRSASMNCDINLHNESGNGKRYIILDGVMRFDLLELPDLPKTVDFWTIRPLIANDLSIRSVPFPSTREDEIDRTVDGVEGVASSNVELTNTTDHEEEGILVSYSIGSGMFIHPLATVKWWDSDTRTWRSDGISEVEIERAKGIVQFKLSVFRPCALVQEAFWDYPPEDWKIYPVLSPVDSNANTVRISLTGKWVDLEIECSELGVALVKPNLDRFQELMTNRWNSPTQFFATLARFGYSFLSPNSLATVTQVTTKSIDDECYFAMAMKCNLLCFSANNLFQQTNNNFRVFYYQLQDKENASVETNEGIMNKDSTPGDVLLTEEAGAQTVSSIPATSSVKHILVSNYDHIILKKSRKIHYEIHPDGIIEKWAPDTKPHGSLFALLNDVALGPIANWPLVMTVMQVLRIITPLNISPPTNK